MDEDSQEDEMEEDGEMEEDEFFGQQGSSRDYHHQPFMQPLLHPQQFQQPDLSFQQPGPSQDYCHQQSMQPIPRPQQFQQPDLSFRQPGPSQDHYYQQFRQPSPHLLLDSQHFQRPGLGWDYQQSWNPTLQQDHQQPLQPAPFPFIPPELESRKAQRFSAPMPMIFRNIGHMQDSDREWERAHYLGRLPIDLPRIRKVFVYDPRRPPKECRGQLFQTGVIKATGDITITAPLPSQRDLPPMHTTPLPIAASPVAATSSHPYARQHSTNEELKRLMQAAKSNMRHKVLLENAMPETRINAAMAEAALLAASQDFMSGIAITQIPRYETCLKTLCTLTTTIWVTHRQQRVPTLVENHAYLFADERYEQGSLSPVNHPGVFTVIIAAVWETTLHEELELDDVDSLDNLYSLGGVATHSVLMEHFSGRCQTVDFSASSTSGAEYRFIQQLNLDIRNDPAVYNDFISSKTDLVQRGRSTVCTTTSMSNTL
ncbi:hypothetical protein BDR05DRAFT_1006122 [Suillus weaverae]|nr:hypothetical protein BDR05DRAFT_1006122 [Suillus weaverae]